LLLDAHFLHVLNRFDTPSASAAPVLKTIFTRKARTCLNSRPCNKPVNRRSFISMAAASAIALSSSKGFGEGSQTQDPLYPRWKKLDDAIRTWWDGDLHRADEEAIRNDPKKTLIFLPFPYSSAGGSESKFPELYGWDTQFINLALLEHDRPDIVRWHILDQLTMIDRFGRVLNGNRTFYLGRGQPPMLPWSVKNYLAKHWDEELAIRVYPSLENEYRNYWEGAEHQTPIGLSTCRDLGSNDGLHGAEAAECEAGLDFTPIFGGDVRRCVPIHVNASLVIYAQTMAMLADRYGWKDKAASWRKEADERSHRINQYCWDEKQGFYFEYDYIAKKQLPCYSLNGFWPLWAGIASKEQAQRVVDHLKMFDKPYGLTFTDKDYPNPHPRFAALEWAYPEVWPPQQIIVALGLERYGFQSQAKEVSRRYLDNVVTTWEKTGLTWERYNGVEGGHIVPLERAQPAPLHGFSSAAAVVVGRVVFG
jgi:alpha,alpha-trehalase